jgi:hypothetical protein
MSKIVLPLMHAVIFGPFLHVMAHAGAPTPIAPVAPVAPMSPVAPVAPVSPVASVAPVAPVAPQMRTYVSGTGSDSNPCTVSSPCKTFQAALALTIARGEIYVLNSANYGPVVINKAVTIISEGAVGGVLATSGAGITISAGANDVINLRGLDIDGGNSGSNGIQFSSGQGLNVERSVVHNFTNCGINFASSGTSQLFVSNSAISNNTNNGILVSSNGSGALNRIMTSGNGVGIFANGGGVNVTITDSLAGSNNYGIAASSAAAVMVRNSTVSNNAIGIAADQSAIVRVGQTTVTANGTGWQASNGGQLQDYGNNTVGGNSSDGTLTSTVSLK